MTSLEASNTSAGTIGGKSFWDEDVEEHFYTRGSESGATRTITCLWDDRLQIVSALAGGTTVNGVVQITAQPMTYPDASWLYVKGIHPTGVGVRKPASTGWSATTSPKSASTTAFWTRTWGRRWTWARCRWTSATRSSARPKTSRHLNGRATTST
jgi:hypothetical protein